jgi:hypothetical protein
MYYFNLILSEIHTLFIDDDANLLKTCGKSYHLNWILIFCDHFIQVPTKDDITCEKPLDYQLTFGFVDSQGKSL